VLVADASAVVEMLVAADPAIGLLERVTGNDRLCAPYLIDIELLHVLRRLAIRGELSEERTGSARAEYAELTITRYPHLGLRDRIWELRHNLTASDAVYVALAEALEAPLITCDGRLAAATGHHADIELFEPEPARRRSVGEESAEGAPPACDP
jgi:predicted nucleic acid-binding protein